MAETHGRGLNEPLLSAGRSKRSLAPLYAVTFVQTLGFCIAKMPALSVRFQHFAADDGLDAAAIAPAFGRLMAMRNVVEFFATPMLSAWSDSIGRRSIMCVTCLSLCVECALLASSRSLLTLSIVHVVAGMFSDSNGTIEGNCIADVLPQVEHRVVAFGRLFTVVGASMVIGPAIGGELAALNEVAPFAAGCALGGASLLFLMTRMPEYLPESQRRKAASRVRMADMLRGYWQLLAEAPGLAWYTAAASLGSTGVGIFSSVQALWSQEVLGWGGQDLGRFISMVGLTLMLAQSILLPYLLSLMKGREIKLTQCCFMIHSAKFVAYGLAPSGRWVHLSAFLGTAGLCSFPLLRSLTSKCTGPAQTGLLAGGSSAVSTASQVFGSIVGSQVFGLAMRHGLPLSLPAYLTAACFVLSAACVARAGRVIVEQSKKDDKAQTPADVSAGA